MSVPHPLLLRLVRGESFPETARVTLPTVDSAVEHGLAPVLDQAIEELDIRRDHDAAVALAMHRLDSASAARASRGAVVALLDAAESLGIEIAVFKGPAIGYRWYENPDLRHAVDIDVFVNPAQTNRVGELVEAISPNPGSRAIVDSMLDEGRVFEYSLVADGVPIDLHLDPLNMLVPARQHRLLWQRTETIEITTGIEVRTLDLEMSIIQALLHLFRDNFADLLHINDVLLMIDSEPDWEFIEAFASSEGLTDLIRFSLGVVCDVAQRPSPLSRDITVGSRILINAVWPERIRLRGRESLASSFRRQSYASLLILGRRPEVARAFVRRIFPPRYIIDDRFPGCECPYLIALVRWRLSQRSENRRYRTSPARESAYAKG